MKGIDVGLIFHNPRRTVSYPFGGVLRVKCRSFADETFLLYTAQAGSFENPSPFCVSLRCSGPSETASPAKANWSMVGRLNYAKPGGI